jgi:hypothetical protein
MKRPTRESKPMISVIPEKVHTPLRFVPDIVAPTVQTRVPLLTCTTPPFKVIGVSLRTLARSLDYKEVNKRF